MLSLDLICCLLPQEFDVGAFMLLNLLIKEMLKEKWVKEDLTQHLSE